MQFGCPTERFLIATTWEGGGLLLASDRYCEASDTSQYLPPTTAELRIIQPKMSIALRLRNLALS